MTNVTKAQKAAAGSVQPGKAYPADEALKLVKELAHAKFAESVDVAINLGIDATKSDQVVRGSTVLPNGSGKKVRVAVFTQGANAEAAKQAGADIVGMDDLAEQMQGGDLNYNVVIASPDAMRVVGKLGQLLGPRGLMPNPKVGTVVGRRRGRGAQRQGRPGALSRRQGRHGALRDRQRELRGRRAEAEPDGARGRPAKGEAGVRQGRVHAEGFRVLDHGSRRARRSVDAGGSRKRPRRRVLFRF